MAMTVMRARHALAACAVACAVAAAGCGTVPAPGAGGHGAGGTPRAKVDLAFTLSGYGHAAPLHRTLRCDPPGGTEPQPAVACRVLLRLKHPFAPLPKGIACPMIIGIGGRIVVTGTWFGQRVHRVILDGGCDFGLFHTVSTLLRWPPPAAGPI